MTTESDCQTSIQIHGDFQYQFDQEFTHNVEIPKLSDDERDQFEGELTYGECKEILQTFKDGTSPGEDGFTAEFYRNFFDIKGRDLIECLNAAHDKGQLSIYLQYLHSHCPSAL